MQLPRQIDLQAIRQVKIQTLVVHLDLFPSVPPPNAAALLPQNFTARSVRLPFLSYAGIIRLTYNFNLRKSINRDSSFKAKSIKLEPSFGLVHDLDEL